MTATVNQEEGRMEMTYCVRRQDGEQVRCEICDCEAPTAKFAGGHPPVVRLLCEFCSTTMASRYTEIVSRDTEGYVRAEIWRAAANVYNLLKHKP